MPALRRAAILRAKGKETTEAESIQRREVRLIQINLSLGVLVLLLTAVARSV
jgi:hypothetical protein